MRIAGAIFIAALYAMAAAAQTPAPLAASVFYGCAMDASTNNIVAWWYPSITRDGRDLCGYAPGSFSNGVTAGAMGFAFNGSGYVWVGNRPGLSITNGAFAVTAWVFMPPGAMPVSGFVSKGKGGVDAEYMAYFGELYGNDLSAYINAPANYFCGKHVRGSKAGWNFVSIRFDGRATTTTNVFASLNGNEGTGPLGSNFSASPTNAGGRFVIGALNNGEKDFMPAGSYIDDVRFYRLNVSSNEVQRLFKTTARGR